MLRHVRDNVETQLTREWRRMSHGEIHFESHYANHSATGY